MPFLHWEYHEQRLKMHNVIRKVLDTSQSEPSSTEVDEKERTDAMLLWRHLRGDPKHPVHIRRTLDQSYYWTIKDTESRDRDQVVYRATEDEPNRPHPDDHPSRGPKVIMVDQLWLWILNGGRLALAK
jgi:hypothetical protein